jgi:hypothetical protein
MRSFKTFAFAFYNCTALLLLSGSVACAADLDSTISNHKLNGTVQDKEKMEASVKLLLAPLPAPKPSPRIEQTRLRTNVEQFSGSTQFGLRPPGLGTPIIVPQVIVPKANAPHIFQTGGQLQFTPALRKPFSYSVETVSPKAGRWHHTATPRNGIMIWSPGYATAHVRQPAHFSNSTSLNFSFSNNHSMHEQQARGAITNYAPAPLQLQAVQQALPIKHAPPPANWNLWYAKVAKAIYAQWKQNTALGPGKALLQLTVYPSCNVAAKVVDFTKPPDANQNLPEETRFREASLKAINSLDGTDIWIFPASAGDLKRVTFELELNHAVGETPGCLVVRTHTEK